MTYPAAGLPEYPPPDPAYQPAEQQTYPAPPASPAAPESWDFTSPQEHAPDLAAEDSGSDYFEMPALSMDMPRDSVAWYWWLAVIFGSFPGAFLAWFVNRGRPGSRAFLFVGIALLILAIAIVALVWLLPGLLLGAQPAPVSP